MFDRVKKIFRVIKGELWRVEIIGKFFYLIEICIFWYLRFKINFVLKGFENIFIIFCYDIYLLVE